MVKEIQMVTNKAFIFDIGNVILYGNRPEEAVKIFEEKGIFLRPKEYKEGLLKERENYFDLYEKGKISFDKFASFFLEQFFLETSLENKELFRRSLKDYVGPPNEEVLKIIGELRKGNQKKILILSNSWPEHEEKVREFDFLYLFDGVYFSHRIGARKPEKEAYLMVLEKEGLLPRECVFIDDKECNIKVAAELGIQGIKYDIRYEGVEKLEKKKEVVYSMVEGLEELSQQELAGKLIEKYYGEGAKICVEEEKEEKESVFNFDKLNDKFNWDKITDLLGGKGR